MGVRRLFRLLIPSAVLACLILGPFAVFAPRLSAGADPDRAKTSGKRLFEQETFGGNGRTCRTCHSVATGTVSPDDAAARFAANPNDPLFRADGSDDGAGNGVTRMVLDATVLMRIPLPSNVTLLNDPAARSVTLRRGIPTTLNTPALDPVLMLDGRRPNLTAQARAAISDHAQPTRLPSANELQKIADFERTSSFFSSNILLNFARSGTPPVLPQSTNDSASRGRRFFEDVPLDPINDPKHGLCAVCHSGPMLNETNQFIQAPPFARGGRFQSIMVSEFNSAANPTHTFQFQNLDGSLTAIMSPDPGRALVTGRTDFESLNAFKISPLWGVARTAPYFHDNSAKTLEDVMRHYQAYFASPTGPSAFGPDPIILTQQDMSDIIAFMRLLQ
jgi:cytochrome c peroxidase